MEKPQIFISHSHDEEDFAKRVKEWLDEALLGAVTFFVSSDKASIPLGTEWPRKIRESLEQSSILIVILSEKSLEKRWIYFEAGAGYVRGIPVIPVCVGGLELNRLPSPLNFLQAIKLPDSNSEEKLLGLVAKSAGLRKPVLFNEINLPSRLIENRVTEDVNENNKLTLMSEELKLAPIDIKSANEIIKQANRETYKKLRKLVIEYSTRISINRWSGNRSDPEGVIAEVHSVYRNSMVMSDNDFSTMIKEAYELLGNFEFDVKNESTSSKSYDHVRHILSAFYKYIPSLVEYETEIYTYESRLYISILLIELERINSRDQSEIMSIIACSEYSHSLLPRLAHTISMKEPGWWDYRESVYTARVILGDSFEEWFKKIKGVSLAEDIRLYKHQEEEKENRRFRERELIEREMLLKNNVMNDD